MNISTPNISEPETGKVNFSMDTLIKLTEALQISADWLIQSNTPAVHAIFDNEISELLSDCSTSQKQAIIKLIVEMIIPFTTTIFEYNESGRTDHKARPF